LQRPFDWRLPEQHSEAKVAVAPAGMQHLFTALHTAPTAQQSVASAQLPELPSGAHAQTPAVQVLVTQPVANWQLSPTPPRAQTLSTQLPEMQSPSLTQAAPGATRQAPPKH